MTQKGTTGTGRRGARQVDAEGSSASSRARTAARTPTYGPEFDSADGGPSAQAGTPLPALGPTAAVAAPHRPERGQPIWIGTRRYGPY